MMNPAIVSFHGPETSQMTAHSSHYPRNISDSFKEEAPGDPFGFIHLLRIVFGEVSIQFSNELDGGARNSVLKSFGFEMNVVDFLSLCQRISVVRHPVPKGVV
jgi:hypothetical protein